MEELEGQENGQRLVCNLREMLLSESEQQSGWRWLGLPSAALVIMSTELCGKTLHVHVHAHALLGRGKGPWRGA